MTRDIISEIEITLDKIRPFLIRDGGDLKFLKFEGGYVFLDLLGACSSCGIQDTTVKQGIEVILQEEVEGVVGVIVNNAPF